MATEKEDLLEEARELFSMFAEAWEDNFAHALEDIKFVKLREQWPDEVANKRRLEDRPCMTFDLLGAFQRQVVNDARQNKPSIKVHPVDSQADPETAKVLADLIRNIEYTSRASHAYDTGVDSAVCGGFGYWRVNVDYAHNDTFDMDLLVQRITNPFSVYGDPRSTEADSSNWNDCFVLDRLTKKQFEREHGEEDEDGAKRVDWDAEGYTQLDAMWFDEDAVTRAEWWHREEVDRPICLLDDGTIIDKARLEEAEDGISYMDVLQQQGRSIVDERKARGYKVTQRLMTGAAVLDTVDWKGRYIPIVPVYGEEFDIEGKRYYSSLIRAAKDPQRNFNYWQTTATELAALAPRAPYIGPVGSFVSDNRWQTANTENHPYLEYDMVQGAPPPTRNVGLDPAAAAALSQAASSGQIIQRVLGMFDASLGAPSNEKSGRAILARQREGDTSTYHFSDNQARSIAHTGRILLDLIPAVYSKRRILRVIGEDGTQRAVPLGTPSPVMGQDGQPQMAENPEGQMIPLLRIHDISIGKYDVTVTTGPSFTTRREEAASQMVEMVRAMPDIAPVILDLLAKNLDWPGADEIAERLKAMVPAQAKGGLPPQVQKQMQEAQQKFGELKKQLDTVMQENARMKVAAQSDRDKTLVDAFKAQTDRIKVMADARIDDASLRMDLLQLLGIGQRPPAPMAVPDATQAAA